MSWEYYLRPVPHPTQFTAEALVAMHAYVRALPSWQRKDGIYYVAETFEYRDEVIRNGTQDKIRPGVQCVGLAPDKITFGVCSTVSVNKVFAEFMQWCKSRWPCEVLDQSLNGVTIEEFLDRQRQAGGDWDR
jgi:hypothetical protein